MKFKLVEDILNESDVSEINKKAKRKMKKQASEDPSCGVDPSFFDNCLRHHVGGDETYETPEQLANGLLSPSINISNVQDPDLTSNAIHFIIEHYTGSNFFDLIEYVYRICNQEVVYHSSIDGDPIFIKDKLYKIVAKINRKAK